MKLARLMTSVSILISGLSLVSPALSSEQQAIQLDDSVTVAVRRLTESQYRHTIRDVFGADIQINARFEPEQREAGLLAIGSAMLSLTSSGFEQYFTLGQSISSQVFSDDNIATVAPCLIENTGAYMADCAADFLSNYGEKLFRRPLTEAELDARLDTVEEGVSRTQDMVQGMQLALTSLLVAPEFLFRIETAEPDPAAAGEYRLDAYTKASRLSFMFWDTAPDAQLLNAAASGAIHSQEGLQEQLQRLIDSPQMEAGARAFFADMMQIDGFANMVKDPEIYPKFNQTIADSAKEQMLKTIVDLLMDQERDYRELFTSNETFINRALASVYKVPYLSDEEWTRYEFDDDSERAGILTQVGFLSLWAHPGTSSPTRRGIKIHEIFMCEPTPDPPSDVDFSSVQASMAGTVRGRLLDHMQNDGCIVCHQRSDPPGLALEHFDGLGQLRKFENGQLIDVSADLFGKKFEGAQGLGQLLYDDPRIPSCLVRNVYAYGVAKPFDYRMRDYFEQQVRFFSENDYSVPALFKQIALTPEFFAVTLPETIESETLAANDSAR
ncbi:MAG: DUF1592 domain-containing protein [Pseudohongiellaceae bacterium]|nr:DUF1592 domain-containing protein [Pseudohongiellaceae bacterium]